MEKGQSGILQLSGLSAVPGMALDESAAHVLYGRFLILMSMPRRRAVQATA